MPRPYWDRERIIGALQKWTAEHGRPPVAADWRARPPGRRRPGSPGRQRPSWGHVRVVFGSWEAALVAANLEAHQPWTPETIVDALREWTAEHGRPPAISDWQRADPERRRPTAQTARMAFGGSWRATLAAAGLTAQKSGGERWEECKRGHPLEGDNVGTDASGSRFCRTCRRARDREYQRRRRAEAAA